MAAPEIAAHLLASALLLLLLAAATLVEGAPGTAWDLLSFAGPAGAGSQLERETSLLLPGLPAAYLERRAFKCVDYNPQLVDLFDRTYNRTYDSREDKMNRRAHIKSTTHRAILLNRVLENEVHNLSRYITKPSIGDYYYLQPPAGDTSNLAFLWYADINDCELGIIKYVMFSIFDRLDADDYEGAYSLLLSNIKHLPLLTADGWEQLCNILLVRLFDRFQADHQMDQLFRWPTYLRKLATFAYSQRQIAQPNFQKRLALITFAYPAYFRDVKYNAQATNRTGDNERAHEAHEAYNSLLNRKLSSRAERNRRLVIFRQRWSLLNKLSGTEGPTDWRQNVSVAPEWLYLSRSSMERPSAGVTLWNGGQSERLRAAAGWEETAAGSRARPLYDSQFADLTDTEFVALINSDYSLVENPKEFAAFVRLNFQPRPLDDAYLNELAAELEFRRYPQALATGSGQSSPGSTSGSQPGDRDTFKLARSVVEELVSQVGMPMGPHEANKPKDSEVQEVFEQFIRFHNKTYRSEDDGQRRDERNRRLVEFTWNLAHFRAWWVQEGWNLEGAQLMSPEPSSRLLWLLRFADMSWWDIKFSLFKLCCLAPESRDRLVRSNATLEYLASNELLCEPLVGPKQNELVALELYYYYSVHYNKHHLDMDSFYKAFAVFRQNLDQLKQLSCPRSLTLELALSNKRDIDVLNSVDTLDQRRIVTDDLNLDRFRYFVVPNLSAPPSREQAPELEPYDFGGPNKPSPGLDYSLLLAGNRTGSGQSERLRAEPAASQGSSFFARLLELPAWQRQQTLAERNKSPLTSSSKRLDRLVALNDLNAASELDNKRYHANQAGRVYELVMQRYRYCAELVRNMNPDDVPQQQCRSVQRSSDLSATWQVETPLTEAESRSLREKDQCAYYLLGLEPWSAGLINQDAVSARLIEGASC